MQNLHLNTREELHYLRITLGLAIGEMFVKEDGKRSRHREVLTRIFKRLPRHSDFECGHEGQIVNLSGLSFCETCKQYLLND